MGEHDSDQRIRLVALGGGGAGKTSVIKRFLFNTFEEKYRSTVEDLYYREYDLGSMTIKVDMLDTAGDFQFPAMRRLSIATANAFLLIYALDSADSLYAVKQCVEEIREHRPNDFHSIPTLVVGNKSDLQGPPQVKKEDVAEWVYCELPRMRVKLMDCSAKTGANVREVFRGFLHLARFPPGPHDQPPGEGLKRRSSEYGNTARPSSARPPEPLERRPSPSPRRGSRAQCEESFGPMEAPPTTHHLKPRSRSLIRRSSKKTSKLGAHNDASTPDDCAPS